LSQEGANSIIQELDELPIKSQGITKYDLKLLIQLITDPYSGIRNSHRLRILKNYLYPKDLIPSESVIAICGSLGVKTTKNDDRRISNTLQVFLLKWLISVYSFLEEADIIERLYGILFNYLEFGFLRPHIAHLLFLSTKKKHINTSRIERLRGLYNKYYESEHLVALLILYKEFSPNEIFDVFPRISHTIFSHPDYTYLNELIALRRQNDKRVFQTTNDELNFVENFNQKLKKRKKNSGFSDFSSSNDFSQHEIFHSISDLCKKIEWTDIPLDSSAILSDKSGFPIYTLMLKGNDEHFARLEVWITIILEEFNSLSEGSQIEFLEMMKYYVSLTSTLPNAIYKHFLSNPSIIHKSSIVVQQYIWYFFTHINPLKEIELLKLLELYLNEEQMKSVDWVRSLLESLRLLFISWPEKLQFLREEKESKMTSEELNTSILRTLARLRNLLPDIIIQHRYNRNLLIRTLSFISVVRTVPDMFLKIEDVVMLPPLVNIFFFVNDPYVISELCGHLNFAKSVVQRSVSSDHTIKLTALHNSYVVDICNSIWRNKAFDVSKKADGTSFGLTFEFINSLMTKVPIFDRNSTFSSLLNINHSPAFAFKSAKEVRALEDKTPDCSTRHAGPLTEASVRELIQDPDAKWLEISYEGTRIEILKALDKAGYVGLADLLFSHLKSLLNKR